MLEQTQYNPCCRYAKLIASQHCVTHHSTNSMVFSQVCRCRNQYRPTVYSTYLSFSWKKLIISLVNDFVTNYLKRYFSFLMISIFLLSSSSFLPIVSITCNCLFCLRLFKNTVKNTGKSRYQACCSRSSSNILAGRGAVPEEVHSCVAVQGLCEGLCHVNALLMNMSFSTYMLSRCVVINVL